MPGQQFEYGFDEIGNRSQASSGGDSTGANLRSTSYTLDSNGLNQYASRTVPGTFDVLGLALGTTTNVTINGQTPDYRKGEYFQEAISNDNSSAALYPSVTVLVNGGGAGSGSTGNVFVAKSPESFAYDADGNLSSDGRWNYTWDGENRLLTMESLSGVPNGSKRKLEFGYDWIGRRIWKKVTNLDTSSTISEAKFLYDGWNLLAELDTSNNLIRSYVWGLDLSGSMQGAGGVGGLLVVKPASGNPQFVAYDGNGNVTALVDSGTGQSTAQYEYGPFGGPIRVSGAHAKANPFRWSTKYTDDESGLVYYGYRYYHANTGRWLSRDPIEELGGVPLYANVSNSTPNHYDVLGLLINQKECERQKAALLANDKDIKTLIGSITGGGCKQPNIICCSKHKNLVGNTAALYDLGEHAVHLRCSCTPARPCRFKQIIMHELSHALDYCNNKRSFDTCSALLCSEIRAYAKGGNCAPGAGWSDPCNGTNRREASETEEDCIVRSAVASATSRNKGPCAPISETALLRLAKLAYANCVK